MTIRLLLSMFLALTAVGCTQSSSNIMDPNARTVKNRNIGFWIGEANYFSSRCPALQININVAEQATNRAGYTSTTLEQDGVAGMKAAAAQFKSRPTTAVCGTAMSWYGANGNRIRNLLSKR